MTVGSFRWCWPGPVLFGRPDTCRRQTGHTQPPLLMPQRPRSRDTQAMLRVKAGAARAAGSGWRVPVRANWPPSPSPPVREKTTPTRADGRALTGGKEPWLRVVLCSSEHIPGSCERQGSRRGKTWGCTGTPALTAGRTELRGWSRASLLAGFCAGRAGNHPEVIKLWSDRQ